MSHLWVLIVFWCGCVKCIRGADKSLALKRKQQATGLKKNVFTLHIPPWAPYTYDFVVLTSLTHPRKIILVVLRIGK
jgi:hypothetical protein